MQQIADWLEKLGMSEYARLFAENRIDFSVLPDLTDQDLKDLGVVRGDRRKILRAIARLKSTEAVAPSPATEAMIARPQDAAERRQVTVMFSDLVGSTALSARMDPEDLREVISAYQKCVAETVQRFGGFVAKYMGDGVLVYFGYPQAHEDDAERAVRAGLDLVAAIGALKTHASLQTRVGIATGLVVVGDLIGSGEAQERGIVGETPNLAARLQGVAEPSAVVMAESTRKLLGNLFELEDLGAQKNFRCEGRSPRLRRKKRRDQRQFEVSGAGGQKRHREYYFAHLVSDAHSQSRIIVPLLDAKLSDHAAGIVKSGGNILQDRVTLVRVLVLERPNCKAVLGHCAPSQPTVQAAPEANAIRQTNKLLGL